MERGDAYGKDLFEDPLIRGIDRFYLAWVVLTLGIPFGIGYAVGGTWKAALEGLVWGGCADLRVPARHVQRELDLPHVRAPGLPLARPARNNWLVALLVFGEGCTTTHTRSPLGADTDCTAGRSTCRGS